MTNTRGKTKAVIPASKKQKGLGVTSSSATIEIRYPFLQFPLGPQKELFQILRARPIGVGQCIDWASLEQVHLLTQFGPSSLPLLGTMVMSEFDNPGIVQFRLGGLVRQLSVPEFEIVLGLFTENFMEADNFPHIHRHMHYAPSSCWAALIPATGIYDPSRSKASALSLALRYLHALLAHTLTGRRESTGVTERHRKGVICISPYVTRLARHFGLLNTLTQFPSLTLIGQMSPQGISSMLHMRMIERHRGFDPPQYRLARATDQDDPEDINDDIPSFHENLPSQPPPSHRPVHAAASLTEISDHLT
ncbi:hypothetical protein GOBAR_AA00099 [Gossypium barbadense]|uniref:Uncharacterized protein n=1 Tax=Gossypium barbadense TaxID=3634 RepID=A0A2P5YY38_GOSBA|nr:hypothetical protein GOBAR_AA00099 [Gossypium barbadense]